ncbi:hypothetical protein Cob_v009375 [Colletotrichum orbiculare MAFF 240422]|uniref:Uncharacterized protein n=1 Tax=Colletotrichum orbiculare (strain 104-T / ATCC 96160 / CBS 514.97 / LARS 414 / MAFF 240422) TaxID=1213857 RepID=A0A484FJS4_COLOR|nr:hypothetical protein Cob_v009375 [Colletotrichum orbiculare MAFF 240422]
MITAPPGTQHDLLLSLSALVTTVNLLSFPREIRKERPRSRSPRPLRPRNDPATRFVLEYAIVNARMLP